MAWAKFHSGVSGIDHFRQSEGGLPAPPPAFADDGLDDDDDDDDDEAGFGFEVADAAAEAAPPASEAGPLVAEEEAEEVGRLLSPFLHCVRFGHMDTKFFWQHVAQPAGLVPADVLAKLQSHFSGTVLLPRDHALLRHRDGALPFAGTQLLDTPQQHLLATWCGQGLRWAPLFQSRTHGLSALAFHKQCDGRRPTVMLVTTANGCLFGAFTAHAWSSNARRTLCHNARAVGCERETEGDERMPLQSFLFTLVNKAGVAPCRFMSTTPHDIVCDP